MRIWAGFLVVAVIASVTPAGADSADKPPSKGAHSAYHSRERPARSMPSPMCPGVEVGHVSLIRGEACST